MNNLPIVRIVAAFAVIWYIIHKNQESVIDWMAVLLVVAAIESIIGYWINARVVNQLR